MGAWQIAARVEYISLTDGSLDTLNADTIYGGDGRQATLGVNWWWTPYSRLQFNYIYGRIEDGGADVRTPGRTLVDGNYNIWGCRFMVDF